MTRYTVWDETRGAYVVENPAEALERLALFENLFCDLREQQRELPLQIAALRAAGKERTVRFRELLGQKLLVESMLSKTKEFGVE